MEYYSVTAHEKFVSRCDPHGRFTIVYRPDDTGGAAHSCAAGHTTCDNEKQRKDKFLKRKPRLYQNKILNFIISLKSPKINPLN